MAYRLKLSDQWCIHDVFHTDLLSPYIEIEAHGPNYKKLPPDQIKGEDEWEVDKILDTRVFGHKRKKQYLVSWMGYPQLENSWINKEDLNANELLVEFNSKHKGPKRQGC